MPVSEQTSELRLLFSLSLSLSLCLSLSVAGGGLALELRGELPSGDDMQGWHSALTQLLDTNISTSTQAGGGYGGGGGYGQGMPLQVTTPCHSFAATQCR